MFELNLPTAATILGIVVAVSTLIGKFLGNKNAIENPTQMVIKVKVQK